MSFGAGAHELLHLLRLASASASLRLTQQSHSLAITSGLLSGAPHLATKLVSAYSACNLPHHSKLVFDSVPDRDVYSWNSLINGFVKNRSHREAFALLRQMCRGGVMPDDYTLASASKVAGETGDFSCGSLAHSKSVRVGFVSDTVVGNSLMWMYCQCEEFRSAKNLFDEMPQRNVRSWNVLITSLIGCGLSDELWDAVRDMQNEGIKPDAHTVSTILPLCGGDSRKYDYGRELHNYILRNNLDTVCGTDAHLACCLIDMYSRNEKLRLGRRVFDRMEFKSVYAWTAMINGSVQNSEAEEALDLFRHMQLIDKIEPNRVSIVSVLPVCGTFAGLIAAKQIHGFSIRRKMFDKVSVSVCNALICAYCKCGSLAYARQIFENAAYRDAISWSSMISGYGIHGKGDKAVGLFEQMLRLRIKPDKITLVGVLSACVRSGLFDKGLDIFERAVTDYKVELTVEICACVVDILTRSNQFDRALKFINDMEVEAGPSVWGAVVNAAMIHGNDQMLDLGYSHLIELEPGNPAHYISVSNLHATSSRWDFVAGVRKMMKEKGLRKEPGCSWIMINGKTNCFYVADKLHPRSSSIYEMLSALNLATAGIMFSANLEQSRKPDLGEILFLND